MVHPDGLIAVKGVQSLGHRVERNMRLWLELLLELLNCSFFNLFFKYCDVNLYIYFGMVLCTKDGAQL
jgi:hypothetical protein